MRRVIARLTAIVALQLLLVGSMAAAATPTAKGDTTLRSLGGSGRAPAHRSVPVWRASQVISFHDPLNGYHPMGITSDGSNYYTTNGGNSSFCVINTFDLTGTLQNTQSCSLDNRTILWDPANGGVFTKTFYLEAARIDPATGASTVISTGWFVHEQSHPALVGTSRLLEHEDGQIRVLVKAGGQLTKTLSGFQFGGYPSDEAVAVDDSNDILTWDGSTVYVQDQNGTLLGTIPIPNGHYGFSLSFTNGLLFTADDVNGSGIATWYGYQVGPA